MNVYRKKPLPAIYTRLRFVRKASNFTLADCPDDLPYLQQLQRVVAGECLSQLERPYWLFVKAEIPDDIVTRDGTSNTNIKWRVFYWKLWDAESLVTHSKPAEAVHLADAGIDIDFLDGLAHPTSCLSMLHQTQILLESHYELALNRAEDINKIEKPLIANLKLIELKQQLKPTANSRSSRTVGDPQVSPKLRDNILRKNNYRCMFCGKDSSDTKLEVNHIIPRSLINKLHLHSALHTEPGNLCVTCFSCNRGKSDNLATEDIEYYRNAFSNTEHQNHGLLPYLNKILEMQTL